MNGRRKGHDWEREVVRRVREVMPGAEVRRGLQYRDGDEAPDCDCPVFHVECKVGRLTNPRAALAQATREAKNGKVPVAVCKDDRQTPFVVMELEDWLEFVRDWWIAIQRG